MAPSKARALLRLERLAGVSRAIRRAWRQGQISWTQAQVLAPLLVLEHSLRWQAAWILRARQVTVRRLGDDVDWGIASGELDPAALPALPAELSPAGLVPAGLQMGARPKGWGATARFFFTGPRDVARLFRAVLATVQRRIERAHARPSNENEAFHAMLEHAIEAWGQRRQQSRPAPEEARGV